MGIIKTKVGNAEILIETVPVSEINERRHFSGMRDTTAREFIKDSISDHVLEVFYGASEAICGIAQELEVKMHDIKSPDELTVSFGMALSAEGNIWMIKGGTNMTINVQMTWKRCEENE